MLCNFLKEGRGHALKDGDNTMKYQNPARSARSAELYRKACGPIPAGVNSTARASWSGWDPYPLFVDRGEGAYLYDVDGNAYIDYLLGLGPMILGHRPSKVTAAVVEQIQNRGTVFALPTEQEARLALLESHRDSVRAQLEETAHTLELIEHKINYYRERLAQQCNNASSAP